VWRSREWREAIGEIPHRGWRSLVTVIPQDETLIGNYAEQFEFHGIRTASIPALTRGRLRSSAISSSFEPIVFASLRHNLPAALSISSVREIKFFRRKIGTKRDPRIGFARKNVVLDVLCVNNYRAHIQDIRISEQPNISDWSTRILRSLWDYIKHF